MGSPIIKKTEELLEPILAEKELDLVDIEYVKEGPNWFLRVYIDKEGGLDITDCGDVSEALGEQLDAEDPIKEAYFLEVSSPGAERPLKKRKDLIDHIGGRVHISLYEPLEGNKTYEGTLLNLEDDILTIQYHVKGQKKEINIPYQKIAKARKAVAF